MKGVLFDDIHSFYDLNLILSSVAVSPAAPKTMYIDIPGGDGSIDLTEALGEVKYSDRVLKFTLTMNPAGDLSDTAWEEKKTEISNLLNGRACKITLDKDPDYYWTGRCVLESYLSQKRVRQFVISATVRPYKYKQAQTVHVFQLSNAGKTVVLHNGRKSVCPVVACSNDNVKLVFDGKTYALSSGTYKYLDIQLKAGNNQMTISGTGTVTFTYQEAEL